MGVPEPSGRSDQMSGQSGVEGRPVTVFHLVALILMIAVFSVVVTVSWRRYGIPGLLIGAVLGIVLGYLAGCLFFALLFVVKALAFRSVVGDDSREDAPRSHA